MESQAARAARQRVRLRPVLSAEELVGNGEQKEAKPTGSPALFSSSRSVALRGTVLNIRPQVILCFSLQMQSPVDFQGLNLIPLSEGQKPHHHRAPTLPTDLVYYYVGKDFGGAGGEFEGL